MPKKKKNAQNMSYTNPIDDAYKKTSRKYTGKYVKKKKAAGGKIIITIFCLLLVSALVLAGLQIIRDPSKLPIVAGNTIAKGVTIAGVDVGGMTQQEAEEAVLAAIGDSYTNTAFVATVLDRQFELTPSLSWGTLDVTAVVEDVMKDTPNASELQVDILPYLNLNSQYITSQIAEFAKFFPTEGEQSGYEVVTEDDTQVMTITIGTEYYDFDQNAFFDAIKGALNNGDFQLDYACRKMNIDGIDLDGIYAQYCTDPVEATMVPGTCDVTESSIGYQFDLESAREALANAKPGDILQFPFLEVEPEMSTEQLKGMLFRDELGRYTARSTSSYNRDTNLKLACKSINGLILYPGDTFSYNAALGERTPEKGYLPASSYLGNETVDTYGGGICQPSSSLYYAALIADLEIVQRSCHGFVSAYMPLGMDATVDWNGPDFKFKNNTDYPIRIDAKASGGTVTVTLVGTDTKDYYVKMEYEVLGVTKPETIEEIVEADSGFKDGEVKTTAYTGYVVQTYKLKYNKETNELISRNKEAYSVYSKRDKVVYKIKQEEVPDESTEPTTPPTDPTDPTTQPTTQPTDPTTQPTDPTTQPTDPTTQPTDPTTQPTEPTTQPTEPTTQPTTQPTETRAPDVGESGGDDSIPGE